MTLNIVIPVLNEEKALQRGVEETLHYLKTTQNENNVSITVADNGSTDKTGEVVGSRLAKGAKVYNRTLIREITSRSLNLILKLLLRVHFTDAMCGFKFYRRETAERLVRICSNNTGWFYCAEMMIRAEWEGISITEIPVIWRDDPDSKVKIGKLSASYLTEILKLYKEKGRRK